LNLFLYTSKLFSLSKPLLLFLHLSETKRQRQFPRASGYPEDPATGIAAAALACSLKYHQQNAERHNYYRFYQGSAMGKPSLIVLDSLQLRETNTGDGASVRCGKATFGLTGRVERDDRETIEIDDDGYKQL